MILEIPPAPVVTGSDVTLLCRTGAASMGTAYFSKNGVYIGSGSKGEFTISKVQRSDDGFYSCATDLTGSSSRSRLIVRGQETHIRFLFILYNCHYVTLVFKDRN